VETGHFTLIRKQNKNPMFYSRLKNAIREQNWFAVVLEILIVVLGVVIGFQITAWSGQQADLKMESSYLNQISADLSRTQAIMRGIDRAQEESEVSAALLFDSFRKIDPLSSDSIQVLISKSFSLLNVDPTLGTMEALVYTGDLSLIRNDSLRLEIPAGLASQKALNGMQKMVEGKLVSALTGLQAFVDLAEANAVEGRFGGTIEIPAPQVNTSNPEYFTEAPFPFSAEEFRNNFEAYQTVYSVHHWKRQAKMLRATLSEVAGELNEMVLRELSK
jgi:hypothetical protein